MSNGSSIARSGDSPDPRDLRCSDADRERVAETLRAAMADGRIDLDELQERLDRTYAARTYRDLEPIVADLPNAADARLPMARPSPGLAVPDNPGSLSRIGGTATTRSAIAVMSGTSRKGSWVVPESFTALAVMGGVELDLREARFEQRSVTITAVAFWGGVEVITGPNVRVVVDGIGIMGGFEGPHDDVDEGGVTVRVTGLALMGGVEVKRKRAKPNRPMPESGS